MKCHYFWNSRRLCAQNKLTLTPSLHTHEPPKAKTDVGGEWHTHKPSRARTAVGGAWWLVSQSLSSWQKTGSIYDSIEVVEEAKLPCPVGFKNS